MKKTRIFFMTLFMTLFFAMSVYVTPESCFKTQSNGDKVTTSLVIK